MESTTKQSGATDESPRLALIRYWQDIGWTDVIFIAAHNIINCFIKIQTGQKPSFYLVIGSMDI